MKTAWKYIASLMAVIVLAGCKEDIIDPYGVENSAVVFESTSVSFSLKGVVEPEVIFSVPVKLVGPKTDYDRPVTIAVVPGPEDNAKENVDFTVLSAVIKAGELGADIELKVKNLGEGVEQMSTVLSIVPNKDFIAGMPAYSTTRVVWSEQYVRPTSSVWKDWFNFFCHGYSRNLHEQLVQLFGEEVERYVSRPGRVSENPDLIYKSIHWWYGASRKFRETIAAYDKAHPDAPLMHSNDFEMYGSYNVAVGEGKKPQETPTILSTLNSL